MPLVSVVIPCHNQARYLPDAVDSVSASLARIEILVVDDGSADETAAVAAALDGVRLFRQEHRGLAAARNRGLQEAAGDFVVFLDSDDRLVPGAIDAGLAAIEGDPRAAFAFGCCVIVGPDGAPLPTPQRDPIDRDPYEALLFTNPLWTPAVAVFRTARVRDVGGFRAGFDAAADYDLYLRLAARWPAIDHGRLVAQYRRHGANMSADASRMLRETLSVLRRHRPSQPGMMAAWRGGMRHWRDFYGTQLVEEIRAHFRRREVGRALVKWSTLCALAPAVAWRELSRKLRVTVRYAGRAMPGAAISSRRGRP